MTFSDFIRKVNNRWKKIRLQPIRVFCFHHVSATYEASYMWDEDWTQMEQFKNFVSQLINQGYTFISLQEAHNHIKRDVFRYRKYAVMTADDGYRSLLNILPWLEERKIPVTLFVNPLYVVKNVIGPNVMNKIGQSNVDVKSDDMYLKDTDLRKLNPMLITLAYHGYEHLDELKIDKSTFEQNVDKCLEAMSSFPNIVPFYAHTYGHFREANNAILREKGLVPVDVAGNRNYDDVCKIDRELISSDRLSKGEPIMG